MWQTQANFPMCWRYARGNTEKQCVCEHNRNCKTSTCSLCDCQQFMILSNGSAFCIRFYMSGVKRDHPKLKVSPFATRHFVDGDIFWSTILEFPGQTELYPMDVNCGHVLVCKNKQTNKQIKQKKNQVFIMLVWCHPSIWKISFLAKISTIAYYPGAIFMRECTRMRHSCLCFPAPGSCRVWVTSERQMRSRLCKAISNATVHNK